MGSTTSISWTGATWNPWHGCEKVSPGCANCYMYRDKARYGQDPTQVVHSKSGTFRAPLQWQHEVERGDRVGHERLVFTCSWSDFFIEEADGWRAAAWDIIRATPNLTYQILTKRPGRLASCLPSDWGQGYPNVWLGVSVENRHFLPRLHVLTQVPAVVRFASFEPLLQYLGDIDDYLEGLDWAIIGGESGPKRRPMSLEWLTNLVDQCQVNGIPTWIKQASAFRDGQQGDIPDDVWAMKQLPQGL